MKFSKIVAGLSAAFISSASMAGVIFSEGFDNINTLAGAGWVRLNQSTSVGTTNWFQGNTGVTDAAAGAPDSYIAANYLNATFGGNVSNWLIAPELTFTGPVTLSFALYTDDALFGLDTVEVYYSGNGNSTNLGDFALLQSFQSGSAAGWVDLSVAIGGAGANDGRFAFRYVVADTSLNGNYIGIDSVSVVPEPTSLALAGLALTGLALSRRRKA